MTNKVIMVGAGTNADELRRLCVGMAVVSLAQMNDGKIQLELTESNLESKRKEDEMTQMMISNISKAAPMEYVEYKDVRPEPFYRGLKKYKKKYK